MSFKAAAHNVRPNGHFNGFLQENLYSYFIVQLEEPCKCTQLHYQWSTTVTPSVSWLYIIIKGLLVGLSYSKQEIVNYTYAMRPITENKGW